MSNANWLNFMSNPMAHHIKRSMFELLKEKYGKHEQIVDRIAHSLVTEKDMKDFIGLLLEIYELGFVRAIEEHKDKLAKLGLGVRITGRED